MRRSQHVPLTLYRHYFGKSEPLEKFRVLSSSHFPHRLGALSLGSKIVVEKGQIVKISKDAKGIVTREQLTKHWTDWIDYWSVDFDFDFENKKEIIRVKDEATGETMEKWTGDFIFENEWQSFRTKKDRSLELTSASREVAKDKKHVKIAVKVVDIFGNDTMTIVDVAVGGEK